MRLREDLAITQRDQKCDRLLAIGEQMLRKHNPHAAEVAFREAVPLAAVPDKALFGLARAQTAQGRHAEALKTYHALVAPRTRRNSNRQTEPYVLMYYALAAAQENHWDEAVAVYNSAIGTDTRPNRTGGAALLSPNFRLNPDEPAFPTLKAMAHIAIGQHALRTGPDAEAVRQFTLATKAMPTMILPYRYLGDALRASGKEAEAQAAYRKAKELSVQR